MDTAEITELMAALGRRMELARVLAYEDADTWELNFDDSTALLVDRHNAHDSLVFSATVARPHPDRVADYHRLLLQYNYQWRQTAGLRMAVEPTGGDAVLIYEMPVARAKLDQLETVVGNLKALVLSWRAALQSGGADGGAPPDPLNDPTDGQGLFVRV